MALQTEQEDGWALLHASPFHFGETRHSIRTVDDARKKGLTQPNARRLFQCSSFFFSARTIHLNFLVVEEGEKEN